MTDRLGYTEREWEQIWSSQSQDDGAQTAHVSSFDQEDYCEACDSEVVYSGPNDVIGKCKCEGGQ